MDQRASSLGASFRPAQQTAHDGHAHQPHTAGGVVPFALGARTFLQVGRRNADALTGAGSPFLSSRHQDVRPAVEGRLLARVIKDRDEAEEPDAAAA